MPELTPSQYESLLAEQAKLLARATKRVTELERILAAHPRGPTVGQAAVLNGGPEVIAMVQSTETMDADDLILHANSRHLGTRARLLEMHDADHRLSSHAHEHVIVERNEDASTQAAQTSGPVAAGPASPLGKGEGPESGQNEAGAGSNGKPAGDTGPFSKG